MTRPLRVLILVSSFAIEGPLGGVARFAVELSRAFDPAQVTPILGALWDYHTEFDQRWLHQLRAEGFEAFIGADWDEAAPYRSCVAALRGLRQQAPAQVDIIHSHGEFNDLAAILLQRRVRAQALMRTVHNEIEWAKRPWFGRLFPGLLYPLTFDAELGVAQRVVENLDRRPLARLRGRRGVRVYNALNFERFKGRTLDRAAKRQSLGIPADALVVGSVGRLVPQKGYSHLIEAAVRVIAQEPRAYFLLIGTGRLADELARQAQAAGLGERFQFTGSRSDVEELYGIMDLFVSSSLWEGLPTVVLESMAAGVPVVATQVAGNMELVEHGKTGWLVPPGQSEPLAAGILQLLQQRAWAQQMAAQARAAAQSRFSITAVATQQTELYRQLIYGRPLD
jgi:glycosyltransferase involved in cell wall biosynthesis